MNCAKCGTMAQAGDKFCSGCGSPVGTQYCPNCGNQVTPGVNFCPNCGKSAQGAVQGKTSASPSPSAAAASGSKNVPVGETVLMDSGTFPISYVKSLMSSINGKLYLTNRHLVFKAGKLQGVGGVAAGGLFIPNPKDAGKSKEYFSIPLSEITAVESGWSHVTVHVMGQKYKFGAMVKTKEGGAAIK